MAYLVSKSKEQSLQQLQQLVDAFRTRQVDFERSNYSEAQLRVDYINPLLKTFGWDVDNESQASQRLREVIQEESIDVEDGEQSVRKNPDYTLRFQGNRQLFVEAKKVSLDIENSKISAFQLRRYGWNAQLGVSVLTNFKTLIFYDCRIKPEATDAPVVARYKVINFTDFTTKFDLLYDLLSYESIAEGKIRALFDQEVRVGESFDEYFLTQIEGWRLKLATTVCNENSSLNELEINNMIQRLLNRIIFLRICEDKHIEKYETLKKIKSYNELKALFLVADKKYNSGLFRFIDDKLSLHITLNKSVLIEIFDELYFPQSPYDFSVVDPSILSQIYEKYLSYKIAIDELRQVSVVQDPEVAASNGVVSTPKFIVDAIVRETLLPLVKSKTFEELKELKIADICCGSGTFLISAYDILCHYYLESYINEDAGGDLLKISTSGIKGLTLKAKREILISNIFGVDINPYAVEVAQFSLLLKLLDGEDKITIEDYFYQFNEPVLPNIDANIKCGNSLIDSQYFKFRPDTISDNNIWRNIKPFDWPKEYSFLSRTNGFDAIIGNPPYVRIQNMVKYAPDEIKFYQSPAYGFSVGRKAAIDKYFLFIERAISLLNNTGILGYIVPHKFFISSSGETLREYITRHAYLTKILHFGTIQIFPGRSTYPAIVILQKQPSDSFDFKWLKVDDISDMSNMVFSRYESKDFNSNPWIFVSPQVEEVFTRLSTDKTSPLSYFGEISVGLQTSRDDIYILKNFDKNGDFISFIKNGMTWEIEQDICRPCIMDLSIELFDQISPNAQIIFPYRIEDVITGSKRTKKAVLLSEAELKTNFPKCWAYFCYNRGLLEKRSIGGKNPEWYQFGRSQSLTKFFETPKIIWHILSIKPTYAYDSQNVLFTGGGNGPYYSFIPIKEDLLLYVLGIIAHPIIERMIKVKASVFRGGYYSHSKQFVENLPIRRIDPGVPSDLAAQKLIISTVKELIKIKIDIQEASGEDLKIFRRKFDYFYDILINEVNCLYGISEQDFSMIMEDNQFSSDLIDNVPR